MRRNITLKLASEGKLAQSNPSSSRSSSSLTDSAFKDDEEDEEQSDRNIQKPKSRRSSILDDLPERAANNRFYAFWFIICSHFLFTIAITVLIILNVAVLATDSYPINYER